MIPSNPAENKQNPRVRFPAHPGTGQAHAAIAAALCAIAILFVLLTAQWVPVLGAGSVSNAGEADTYLQADTATPFELRF